MGYWIVKILFGPVVRLIWVKKVKGLNNIPKKGACIIAANHSSYFDFICLMAVLPRRVHFLAAEKFFKSFFWSPIMKLTGQIKVERKNKDKSEVHHKVSRILKSGGVIGIFPEGTRSPKGRIEKTYTGVGQFALLNKAPVVPVGIKGTFEIMSRFDRFPKLKKNAEIIIGKPIAFREYYTQDYNKQIFREITDKIMERIRYLRGD